MKNNTSKQKNEYPDPNSVEENNVVSSTDCTGAVRWFPMEKETMHNYGELCNVLPQGALDVVEEELKKEYEMDKKNKK